MYSGGGMYMGPGGASPPDDMGNGPPGQKFWPGGIECGTDSGGSIVGNGVHTRKAGSRKKPGELVATTHVAEDLQTEFSHPRFHVGRVIELFAEIEEAAEAETKQQTQSGTKPRPKPTF